MSKDIQYGVIFNRMPKGKKCKCYSYNYGAVKNIRISIAQNAAMIEFSMKTRKEHKDFAHFTVLPLRDAFVKIHMIHALLFGKGLDVTSVGISIDGTVTKLDKNSDGFPCFFSMLGKTDLELDESWAPIADRFCKYTKTKFAEDNRFTSLYAYLLSKTRQYEFDKFQNLWTAMNACYTYSAKCFEHDLRKRNGIEEYAKLKSEFVISGRENLSIGAMSFIIGGNYREISAEESKKLRKNYFQAEKAICRIDDIGLFYEETLNALHDPGMPHSAVYEELKAVADVFEVPVYVFLLLGYPYYWRCKYFHGNYIAPLFMAQNDDDLKVLYVLNYYLDHYLKTEIPSMFEPDYWKADKYDAVLRMFEKCERKTYEKYKNGKIIREESK